MITKECLSFYKRLPVVSLSGACLLHRTDGGPRGRGGEYFSAPCGPRNSEKSQGRTRLYLFAAFNLFFFHKGLLQTLQPSSILDSCSEFLLLRACIRLYGFCGLLVYFLKQKGLMDEPFCFTRTDFFFNDHLFLSLPALVLDRKYFEEL